MALHYSKTVAPIANHVITPDRWKSKSKCIILNICSSLLTNNFNVNVGFIWLYAAIYHCFASCSFDKQDTAYHIIIIVLTGRRVIWIFYHLHTRTLICTDMNVALACPSRMPVHIHNSSVSCLERPHSRQCSHSCGYSLIADMSVTNP